MAVAPHVAERFEVRGHVHDRAAERDPVADGRPDLGEQAAADAHPGRGRFPRVGGEPERPGQVFEAAGEGWEHYGAEEWARYVEGAIDFLDEATNKKGSVYDDNPVVAEVLEEAINYLEQYELERSRAVLLRQGGSPRETTRETGRRELWEEWSGKLED